MKKILASVLTGALVTPVLVSNDNTSVYAEKEITSITAEQTQEENEEVRTGLLGYYFKGANFNDLVTFAPTHGSTLMYNPKAANQLLEKDQQTYQSIRWVGFIKSKETGKFTFKLSDDEHAVIEIDGKLVSNQGKEKQAVHVEKDKLVPIKIEYRSNTPLQSDAKLLQDLKLYKMDEKKNVISIEKEDLTNPDFQAANSKDFLKQAAKTTLFKGISPDSEYKDTDGDSIPDIWEENGYTIQNRVAVKWTNDLASKGYTKFISNPHESHTVGDPYTDYEKAARDIDKSNAKETFNPLVAALPRINVSLDELVVSENEDLSDGVWPNISHNWTFTNLNYDYMSSIGDGSFSYFISKNYHNSEVVGVEWGHTDQDTEDIERADTVYLNANVRYNNVGTGSIYNAKATTRFVLEDDVLGTIKTKEKLNIPQGKSYPEKGRNGIPINTMEDFDFKPISLDWYQADTFIDNDDPIFLENDHVDGEYKVRNVNGSLITGGKWHEIIPHIQAHTASIIINSGENVSEKYIAAKDYDHPEDKTPSLTLKEALKISNPEEIQEGENGLLYYKGKPIHEASILSFLDEKTAREVEKQLDDKTGKFKDVKRIYDVKLTPKMNFTIKLSTVHDGAENFDDVIGEWDEPFKKIDGGNTGLKSYRVDSDGESILNLNEKIMRKLKLSRNYVMSMYIKVDNDYTPSPEDKISILSEDGSIYGEKKLKPLSPNDEYQRIDIDFHTGFYNKVNRVAVNIPSTFLIDDISITELQSW
ncbi:binary toxin-like calcium binding domain-containing protein [Bacillus bombysepticus]|nr:binary toxin-like calcium binding domain-containing protein [Bacillus cereus]TKH27702.1 hypothetical protein FC692_15025 [Bacillus cereus]